MLAVALIEGRMMSLSGSIRGSHHLCGLLLTCGLCLPLLLLDLASDLELPRGQLVLPLFVLDQRVQEDLVVMVDPQHLQRLVDPGNGSILFFDDLPEVTGHLTLLGLGVLVVLGRLLCLILDLVEEVDKALGIGRQHVLTGLQTVLTHVCVILEPLDFSLLGLEHLLDQEHLPLLLDELVAVLLVLGALNRDREARCLPHIDLTLYLRVDSQSTGLDIGLAYFPKAALPGGSVFLPYFK